MITYEQAKEKALKQDKNIDTVLTYEDAYVFYNSKARGDNKMNYEVVIRKSDGKIITMSEYVMTTNTNKKPSVKPV